MIAPLIDFEKSKAAAGLAKPSKKPPDDDWNDLTPLPKIQNHGIQIVQAADLTEGDCCFGSDLNAYLITAVMKSFVPGDIDLYRTRLNGKDKGEQLVNRMDGKTKFFVYGNRGAIKTLDMLEQLGPRGFPTTFLDTPKLTDFQSTSTDVGNGWFVGNKVEALASPVPVMEELAIVEQEVAITVKTSWIQGHYNKRSTAWGTSPLARLKFRLAWIFHNLVAHSLIALAPSRPTFRLHDWSATKLAKGIME